MIDLAQFEVEARDWGIPLSVRFALQSVCETNLKPLDEFSDEDHRDLAFRQAVADVLIAHDLAGKAHRYLDCARKGYLMRCEGPEQHEFFSPHFCDLRFCLRCAPRRFARLFAKHAPVLDYVRSHPSKGFLLREITLTSRNTGGLSSEQIKTFNEHVKLTLRGLTKGAQGWGAIYVDEVGFNNTNLHAHILFWGPYIAQKRLAAVWQQVSGNEVAWINQAHVTGSRALLHLLKYVSKPPADDPRSIGNLEVAFHGTRRVHALGLFYNFTQGDEGGLESEWQNCPKCGAKLAVVPGLKPVSTFKTLGIECISSFPKKKREKQWMN